MDFTKKTALFLTALGIAFVGGLWGVTSIGGRDIGFAGAGILLFPIPAALIGALLAYPISRTMTAGPGLWRAAYLLAAALFCGWLVGATTLRIFIGLPTIGYVPMPSETGPGAEDVFVPRTDARATMTLSLSDYAQAGKPVALEVAYRHGQWQKIPRRDVQTGIPYFDVPPLPDDPRIKPRWTLRTDPQDCARIEMATNADRGTAVFSKDNALCKVWLHLDDPVSGQSWDSDSHEVSVLR